MEIRNDFNIPLAITLDGLTLKNGLSPTGGALFIEELMAVTVRNSTISNNASATEGGGIWVKEGASLTLINSTIDGNRAGLNGNFSGGGVFSNGTLSVTGSTVSNNRAPQGAGIYNAGLATIIRSTVTGNVEDSPSENVGGILTEGTLHLLSSTITKNVGFGLAVFGGAATVGNSIVVGTSMPCAVGAATLTSIGHNMSNNKNACFFIAAGDVEIDGTLAFTQVLESDLKHNGGPTKTHALIARGLAVDKGYCPGETVDQRGFARPVDEPTLPNAKDGCDMGAYESQGPQVAVSDLMVSQSVDKSSVKQGDKLTYTVRVQNLGPQTAPDVVLNNVLSSGVTFVEARVNNGKGTTTAPPFGETGTVTWNIGDMLNGANEYVEIKVTVLVKGKSTITNSASVTGNVADPNSANNSAAITVSVTSGKAAPPRG